MGAFKRFVKSKDGVKTPYWYIRYAMNGNMKWESVGKVGVVTKDVARARLEERKRQVRLGQLDMIGAKIPTLSNFSDAYIKYQKDVKKKRSWKRDVLSLKYLKSFFGTKKLSEITPKDIDDYKESRIVDVAPATVNRELEVLRHLFNIADRWKKFFGKNPVSQAGLFTLNNQVERILTPEEELRLFNYCNPYLKPILICALNTGMRKSEILTLEWKDVDLETNLITIVKEKAKNKKTEKIPISSALRKLLLGQKLKTFKSGYVFLNSKGEPYRRHDSLNQIYRRALKLSGIQGLRFHDLRHTAATRMIEAGVNIVSVNKILRHADLKTTMRYAHPEDSLKDAVEKLGNFTSNYSKNCSNEINNN